MKRQQNNEPYSEISKQLADHLSTIEIPEELDLVVQRAIKEGQKQKKGKFFILNGWSKKCVAAAMLMSAGFIATANLSPTFAQSLEDIPVLGKLVEVVSFTQFNYQEDTYEAIMETPVIEGLEDKTLQDTLNHRYAEENQKYFKQFEEEVADIKALDKSAHLGINSSFEIKTDNDQILSIAQYVVNTAGSSSTTMTYTTLDKQNEKLITLPGLFKDDSYISVISANIISQMRSRMAEDATQYYWITGDPEMPGGFKQIKAEQNFYISEEGKLIICFDKYEVSPGAMGIPEFEIPTEILQDILVNNYYIN